MRRRAWSRHSPSAIERAYERVIEAVEKGIVSTKLDDPLRELLSYPIARALVAYFNNDWLRRRYTYAEERRIERMLVTDEPEVLEFIAMKAFKAFRAAEDVEDYRRFGEYKMNSREHLQIACSSGLSRELRWKLVNHVVKRGLVYLNAAEVARLVRAVVQIVINNRFSQVIPERVRRCAESIRIRVGEAVSRVRRGLEAVSGGCRHTSSLFKKDSRERGCEPLRELRGSHLKIGPA